MQIVFHVDHEDESKITDFMNRYNAKYPGINIDFHNAALRLFHDGLSDRKANHHSLYGGKPGYSDDNIV